MFTFQNGINSFKRFISFKTAYVLFVICATATVFSVHMLSVLSILLLNIFHLAWVIFNFRFEMGIICVLPKMGFPSVV